MIRRLSGDEIKAGMYIVGFGGSWFNHPFWRSKFLLTSPDDVAKIRKSSVSYVLIDDELGVAPDVKESSPPSSKPELSETSNPRKRNSSRTEPSYAESSRSRERKVARELMERSTRALHGIFDDARLGKAVHIEAVTRMVDEIYEAVERSRHTLINMIRLKTRDEYTYAHSVAVCTLMVNVARHMGFPEATIREFGQAGLLHDIGKMGVPNEVLNKPGRLTEQEFALMMAHPEQGHALLQKMPDVAEAALDVCLHHHEKMDGTGYPFGMTGEAISIATRLGAICDVYDALTSDRIYKDAWTPTEAINAMWNWQGHFDAHLLFGFMQSINIFPSGMLVQLRSNRLGVILESSNSGTPLRIFAFYSTRDRCYIPPETIIIKENSSSDHIVAREDPEAWGFIHWDTALPHLLRGKVPPLAA